MFKKKILIFLFILILVFGPYIVVEIKTIKYEDIVKNLYEQTGIIDSNNYCKVLKYSDYTLEIIYADTKSVNKCWFEKQGDNWVLNRWETIYSTEGSASNFRYPIYFPKQDIVQS